jgi:SepF-like predicted cell division protein (DUF552 family)
MKPIPPDQQAVINTLDELSKTVDVMSHVISRLQEHVENLTQQRSELMDDAVIVTPPKSLH